MQAILTHTGNVQRTEDQTLSFLALESIEDDISIVLFERYTTKKYFEEVHFTSDSMKEFRSKVRALQSHLHRP
jgi:quinol monooxygenase YgiN